MPTTLGRTPTFQDRIADGWDRVKLPALMLAVGLIAGPLLSNSMGWQVTRSAAERQSANSAIHQQAMICAYNAGGDIPDATKLDWSARRALSEKYAVMPGRDMAEPGVASACAQMLTAPA